MPDPALSGPGALERDAISVAEPVESKREGLTMLIRSRNHRAFLPDALRGAIDAMDTLER